MTILVTGAAGFIGFYVAKALLERGERVLGIDNLNDYYQVSLKTDRLAQLEPNANFEFQHIDISDNASLSAALKGKSISRVVHLAAQAGVRYSLQNPHAYVQSNVVGHLNLLEFARHCDGLEGFVYASSSSVYGGNDSFPFCESDRVDTPVSLYAATKKSDELISQSYTHLYGLKQVGLRFFTVYGPWGRPDMAMWLFTEAILKGAPLKVFNHGNVWRDFTYIDDIVAGTLGALDFVVSNTGAMHKIYNIGNNQPEQVTDFIRYIERATGKEAIHEMLPMQAGDVVKTYANIDALKADTGYQPTTSLEDGVQRFVDWYKRYHAI